MHLKYKWAFSFKCEHTCTPGRKEYHGLQKQILKSPEGTKQWRYNIIRHLQNISVNCTFSKMERKVYVYGGRGGDLISNTGKLPTHSGLFLQFVRCPTSQNISRILRHGTLSN